MTDAPRPLTTAQRLEDLRERDAAAVSAADDLAVQKQHARGKKTARERITDLLDDGSFVETDRFVRHQARSFGIDAKRPDGDGIVTGYGTIDGRQVCVYSQDFTVFGGSLGEVHGQKITKVQDLALRALILDHKDAWCLSSHRFSLLPRHQHRLGRCWPWAAHHPAIRP